MTGDTTLIEIAGGGCWRVPNEVADRLRAMALEIRCLHGLLRHAETTYIPGTTQEAEWNETRNRMLRFDHGI
jgi:hypothetical protein